MEEVLLHMPMQVPLWVAAADGRPDWEAIYNGYRSGVDWPTAGFFRELRAAYPHAKFVLTIRSPESWVQSFSETIYKLTAGREQAPQEMQAWLDMAIRVIAKTGFPNGLSATDFIAAFIAHNNAVKAVIPAEQLLVYQVKDGWDRPRTNDRGEFWDRVSGKN
jgi:hypothetical protein